MNGRRRFLKNLAVNSLAVTTSYSYASEVGQTPYIWPSERSEGSVELQTAELENWLNSSIPVTVRAGEHLINGPIICSHARVTLVGMPNAVIVVQQNQAGGLRFDRCESAIVKNLKLMWSGAEVPGRSHYGAGLLFIKVREPLVENLEIHRAPGAGVHFDECYSPRAKNITVKRTGADGLHFANCNNSFASDIFCYETGDDAIAFVDYKKKSLGKGFILINATIHKSYSRGIAVVGACDGRIEYFDITDCASNCIHVEQDAHYQTRYPNNVVLENGIVRGSGTVIPNKGNQYGVNILRAQSVHLSRISIHNSFGSAISIVDSENIVLEKLVVNDTSGTGIKALNSKLILNTIKIDNFRKEAINISKCSLVQGHDIEVGKNNLDYNGFIAILFSNEQIDIKSLSFERDARIVLTKKLILAGNQTGTVLVRGLGSEAIKNNSENVNLRIE